MRTKIALLPLCLLAAALCLRGAAQPTVVGYQGQLLIANSPANGNYDLTFALYTNATGGTPLAGPITNSSVLVNNGLFAVYLPVNPAVFDFGIAGAHFLEIAARPSGNSGPYTVLSPRQPLTQAPYAVAAQTAAIADNVLTNSVTATGIASGQVVKSLNGLTDNVGLAAGCGLTLSTNGNLLEISACPSCFVSVKDFGAVGDGTANDTAALQATLNSGAAAVCVPKGQYLTDALTVPPTVRRLFGEGEFVQHTVFGETYPLFGGGLLNVVNATNVTIEGLQFTGIPDTAPAGGNSAIFVLSSQQVRVRGNRFTQWRTHAVYAQSSDEVLVSDNLIYAVAGGVRFTGVERSFITQNSVRDTQLAPTNFTVAIGLDSSDGHSYGICRDIVIAGNTVKTYVNSQAILVHAGERITVIGNVLDDVFVGVSVNPFNTNDTLRGVAVVGNIYRGTSTPGAPTTNGNNGIFISGGDGFNVEDAVVQGNVVSNANAVARYYGFGGIVIGYAQNVVVADNAIRGCVGVGFAQFDTTTGLLFHHNSISDILTASDGATAAGIYILGAGNRTGRIEGNRIERVAWCLRADVPAPGLRIGDNDYSSYAFKVVNPANFAFDRGSVTIADTSASATVPFGAPEPDAGYYVSAVVSATTGTPAAGSSRVYVNAKTVAGFTIKLEAPPGLGNSVTMDWILKR